MTWYHELILSSAIREGDMVEIRKALASGADVNARTESGWTPLHWACRKGQSDIISFLLTAGADVNARDKDGWTVLHRLCESTSRDVIAVKCLLDAGADVRARAGLQDFIPLQVAARWGNLEFARILVSADSDLNAQGESGHTPLHLACVNNDPAIVRFLLESGADPEIPNKQGKSALETVLLLSASNPGRYEELLVVFQELAPEAYFSKFCTAPMPGCV